jgi:CO/xanthine dehydrogenase Mo-binding subunit
MNCVAAVTPNDCELWAPTQAPNSLQEDAAEMLGFPLEKVKVHVTTMGGGFGRRLANDYAFEAIEVSRGRAKAGPGSLDQTRRHPPRSFSGGLGPSLGRRARFRGKLIRWRHTEAASLHNLHGVDKPPTPNDAAFYQGYAWGVYDLPYTAPDLEMAYVPVDLPVKHGPWRSVFAPSSVFARESFIDELAHAQSADPLAFRLDLLRGDEPIKAGDITIDRTRLRRVLETSA